MRVATIRRVLAFGVALLAAAGCTSLGITAKVPTLTASVRHIAGYQRRQSGS